MELAQVESEIEKLLDTLTGATPVLISYANAKIEELGSRRRTPGGGLVTVKSGCFFIG